MPTPELRRGLSPPGKSPRWVARGAGRRRDREAAVLPGCGTGCSHTDALEKAPATVAPSPQARGGERRLPPPRSLLVPRSTQTYLLPEAQRGRRRGGGGCVHGAQSSAEARGCEGLGKQVSQLPPSLLCDFPLDASLPRQGPLPATGQECGPLRAREAAREECPPGVLRGSGNGSDSVALSRA